MIKINISTSAGTRGTVVSLLTGNFFSQNEHPIAHTFNISTCTQHTFVPISFPFSNTMLQSIVAPLSNDTLEFRPFDGAKYEGNLDSKIKKPNLKHHDTTVNSKL